MVEGEEKLTQRVIAVGLTTWGVGGLGEILAILPNPFLIDNRKDVDN